MVLVRLLSCFSLVMRTLYKLLFVLIGVAGLNNLVAQPVMAPLPGPNGVSSSGTRGYMFVAPSDFIIVGLRVPTDIQGNQSLAVVEFTNGQPPSYPAQGTNWFNTLFLTQDNPNNGIINVNIPISQGDMIGILGTRSTFTTRGTVQYSSSIAGNPVTFQRIGMPYYMAYTAPQAIWREPNWYIGRVEMWYTTCNEPIPQVMGIQNILCHGDSTGVATGSATGGAPPYTFIWPTTGDTAVTTTTLPAGNHTLKIVDDANCSTTTTFDITEADTIITSMNKTEPICYNDLNGSAAVNVMGGVPPYSYSWPSGSTSANDSGLGAGYQTVTITDSNGCILKDSILLNQPDSLFISVDSIKNVTCEGDEDGQIITSAVGGTGPFSFVWNTNKMTSTIVGLKEGTYGVTLTDNNNCEAITSETVTYEHALPVINLSNVNSQQSFADLDAPAGFTHYEWDNGSNAQSIRVFKSGDYTVTVTDEFGCSNTETVSVTVWATGIDEQKSFITVKLFPNPTDDILNLNIEGLESNELSIKIMNLNGQIIEQSTISNGGTSMNKSLNLSNYPAGFYLLELSTAESSSTHRIQVVR